MKEVSITLCIYLYNFEPTLDIDMVGILEMPGIGAPGIGTPGVESGLALEFPGNTCSNVSCLMVFDVQGIICQPAKTKGHKVSVFSSFWTHAAVGKHEGHICGLQADG